MEGREAAPTGCYKCGRPGHWSRDCPLAPSDASNVHASTNFKSNAYSSSKNQHTRTPQVTGVTKSSDKTSERVTKRPRTRPKLTPEILLSDDGIGYILRHFPRAFKYRGRGHEASDLENLISLYAQWHSHLLPYFSFSQFIEKVEKVGATKHVKMCIRELRDRVASGCDPTVVHKPSVESRSTTAERDEAPNLEDSIFNSDDPPPENPESNEVQEEILEQVYRNVAEKMSSQTEAEIASQPLGASETSEPSANQESISNNVSASELQRARMESNRQKALAKLAARGQAVASS